ncbi:tartrate-resistant acid phosphatase type 5 precursor, partial [Trypanosoma conorhini]
MPAVVGGRSLQLRLAGAALVAAAAAVVVVVGVVEPIAAAAAAPGAPLAEVAFAAYNPGSRAASGEEGGDFCFISHGCWGGKSPRQQRQREVAALIARLIEDAAGRRDERIRFVVAAGDNFYPRG